MANVKTGFSLPYVALYAESSGTVTYSSGQKLARGVSVSFSINAADSVNFYADNILAESAGGVFTDGEVTLTVDGLDTAAEKLIFNLPTAGADGFTSWGDDEAPFVGIGFIVRTMYLGVEGFQAIVLPKCKFNVPGLEAATQEDVIAFQTQELTAAIFRDDTAGKVWLKKGTVKTTEALAEADIKTMFSIS